LNDFDCGVNQLFVGGQRITWIKNIFAHRLNRQLKPSGTEVARLIANHESPRTTKLYDRRHDEIESLTNRGPGSARRIAGHAGSRTTKLYDHRDQKVAWRGFGIER
jgi:hypothetical protein